MDDKVSALDPIPVVDRATDLFYIVDSSAGTSNNITVNNVLGITGAPVGNTDVQTLTNKTITTPTLTVNDNALTIQDNSDTTKKLQFQLSGITTGTTRTLTIPDANDTIVGLAATQTLTNKTLTSPTINTATIVNPTMTVDSISEFTAGNGVTVDGLNIKDGKLNTANSVVASNYTDGSIAPEHLYTGSGTSWAEQTYAVTWGASTTPPTIGDSVVSGTFTQTGKKIEFMIEATIGATFSAGTGTYTFTLPAATRSYLNRTFIGVGHFFDSSTSTPYPLAVSLNTSTNFVARRMSDGSLFTAAAPAAPATNDIITLSGTYYIP